MIPASSKPLWFLGGIVLLLLTLVGLFSYIAYSSRTIQFEISEEGLNIRGGLYQRLIPAEAIIIAESKQVDIGKESPYKPVRRTKPAQNLVDQCRNPAEIPEVYRKINDLPSMPVE